MVVVTYRIRMTQVKVNTVPLYWRANQLSESSRDALELRLEGMTAPGGFRVRVQ